MERDFSNCLKSLEENWETLKMHFNVRKKENGPKCEALNTSLENIGKSISIETLWMENHSSKSKREKYFQQKCVKEFVFCVPNHQILQVEIT